MSEYKVHPTQTRTRININTANSKRKVLLLFSLLFDYINYVIVCVESMFFFKHDKNKLKIKYSKCANKKEMCTAYYAHTYYSLLGSSSIFTSIQVHKY